MLPSLLIAFSQDTPVQLPKSEIPKTPQVCVVCEADGVGHGAEKALAAVRYKGTIYSFCNPAEVGKFTKDPNAYLPPVLPRAMPEFALPDTTGKVWNPDAMKGRLILIDFWASWCKPCKEMKPILERVSKQFASLTVLSVSIDEKRSEFDKFMTKNTFANPVLFDDRGTWAKWGVRVVPTFFLVKDGQIVGQWAGKKSEKEIAELVRKHG